MDNSRMVEEVAKLRPFPIGVKRTIDQSCVRADCDIKKLTDRVIGSVEWQDYVESYASWISHCALRMEWYNERKLTGPGRNQATNISEHDVRANTGGS